jgi:hypothetical protein
MRRVYNRHDEVAIAKNVLTVNGIAVRRCSVGTYSNEESLLRVRLEKLPNQAPFLVPCPNDLVRPRTELDRCAAQLAHQ